MISTMESSKEFPQKIKHRPTILSRSTVLGNIPKAMKIRIQ
jgi:hypothetical protein